MCFRCSRVSCRVVCLVCLFVCCVCFVFVCFGDRWGEEAMEDACVVCVVLAAGFGTRLRASLEGHPQYGHLAHTPKPLLPLAQVCHTHTHTHSKKTKTAKEKQKKRRELNCCFVCFNLFVFKSTGRLRSCGLRSFFLFPAAETARCCW